MKNLDKLAVNDLQKNGIGLIVCGIISVIWFNFLDPIWGVGLIIIGIFTLMIKRRVMFIVFGIVLLLAGFLNIVSGIIASAMGWSVFGAMQIGWAFREMKKFSQNSSIYEDDTTWQKNERIVDVATIRDWRKNRKIAKSCDEAKYTFCPKCGFEQWSGYDNCQKCGHKLNP